MLTERDLILIQEMDTICHKCVRSIYYCKALSLPNNNNLWSFTQNCYGEVGIILWCKIFGTYNEMTHYCNLFEKENIEQIDPSFSKNVIKRRLLSKINYSESNYNSFHNEMRSFRNKWFAHSDMGQTVVFPDIDIAKVMCLEMRDILKELLEKGIVESNNQELKDTLLRYIEHNDNDNLLIEFESESTILKAARDLSFNESLLREHGYLA